MEAIDLKVMEEVLHRDAFHLPCLFHLNIGIDVLYILTLMYIILKSKISSTK